MNVPYHGPPLKLGSRGNPVYAIKRALKAAGHARATRPNTLFGPGTVSNVREFQKFFALRVDGQVGPLTLLSLSTFFDDYSYFLYTGRKPGGRSMHLLEDFVPTHQTGGLVGFPAIDLFAPAGTHVLTPENGEMVWPHLIHWNHIQHVGGWTCYFHGLESGNTYFLTHFGMLNVPGEYAHGALLGTVAQVPGGWWPSHIHEGRHVGRYDPDV